MTTTIDIQDTIRVANGLLAAEQTVLREIEKACLRFTRRPESSTLVLIQNEHRRSIDDLTRLIAHLGQRPASSEACASVVSNVLFRAGNLFGPDSITEGLMLSEDNLAELYLDVLDGGGMMPEFLQLISHRLLPRVQRHVQTLEFMENEPVVA